MIKVTKWSRKQQKEDWARYRAEIKSRKYNVWQNIIYILREIWKIDKMMIISCFAFAMAYYVQRLCVTFTDKYIVELATEGLGNTRLLIICLALIIGGMLCRMISDTAGNYQGFIGFNILYNNFALKVMHKNMTTDYENNEKPQIGDRLNKAREGLGVIGLNVGMNVRGTIRHTLEFFTYSALLLTLDIRILPIIVLPVVVNYYIERHKMNWIWNMQNNWQNYDRQLHYIRNVGADFSYAKDVRIFGMQEWLEKVFARSLGD